MGAMGGVERCVEMGRASPVTVPTALEQARTRGDEKGDAAAARLHELHVHRGHVVRRDLLLLVVAIRDGVHELRRWVVVDGADPVEDAVLRRIVHGEGHARGGRIDVFYVEQTVDGKRGKKR